MVDWFEQASCAVRATIGGHDCVLPFAIELIDRLGLQMCPRQDESIRSLDTPLRRRAPVFGPSHVCSRIIISARGLLLLLSTCEASLARARLKISELAAVPAPPSQCPSQYPRSLNGNSSFSPRSVEPYRSLIVLRPHFGHSSIRESRNGRRVVARARVCEPRQAGSRTALFNIIHIGSIVRSNHPLVLASQVTTDVRICFARQHCRHRNKAFDNQNCVLLYRHSST
jgi:hypothetical protein